MDGGQVPLLILDGRYAEIGEDRPQRLLLIKEQQDIARLDVAVQNALIMQVGNCFTRLPEEPQQHAVALPKEAGPPPTLETRWTPSRRLRTP